MAGSGSESLNDGRERAAGARWPAGGNQRITAKTPLATGEKGQAEL